ncbi:hypothetical protein [Hankyongella ginsenosidimutans]|uniref:hypothetical protein n=1 Tax=Hankyongella ginsenosidimutans TaxID=1763828 RepID=UPI001CA35F5B|nr:hypothetical protein [Hankyongella ginsenosidimutans]
MAAGRDRIGADDLIAGVAHNRSQACIEQRLRDKQFLRTIEAEGLEAGDIGKAGRRNQPIAANVQRVEAKVAIQGRSAEVGAVERHDIVALTTVEGVRAAVAVEVDGAGDWRAVHVGRLAADEIAAAAAFHGQEASLRGLDQLPGDRQFDAGHIQPDDFDIAHHIELARLHTRGRGERDGVKEAAGAADDAVERLQDAGPEGKQVVFRGQAKERILPRSAEKNAMVSPVAK